MEIYKNLNIDNLENEYWKSVKDYLDYYVSNLGRVKSLKYYKNDKTNKRILRQIEDKDGYLYVNFCKNKKSKHIRINILVYETFNNYKLKDNECVHHIDEEPKNNIYSNLKLSSKNGHNTIHKIGFKHSESTKNLISKNHSNVKGENHPRHKLTEEQIIQIKLLLREDILTQQEIADMFGVSQQTISDIKYEKRWSHIKV